MGFPSIYGGLLPLVVVNTAISLALVKNLVDSLLRIVGLKRDSSRPRPMEASWQQQQQQQQGSNLASDRYAQPRQGQSFVEEIQSTLPLIEFRDVSSSPVDISSPGAASSDRNEQDEDQDQDREAQCAVCLCDFEPSSLVRKLPNCSHTFHRDCLDKWLNHNQTTCPMCRSSLLTLDLARKHRQQEEILAEELALWLSVYHTSGLARGPWWYRGHGSGFATGWDFH